MKDKILRFEPDIKKVIVEFRKRDFGTYTKVGNTRPAPADPFDLDEPSAPVDSSNNPQNLPELHK